MECEDDSKGIEESPKIPEFYMLQHSSVDFERHTLALVPFHYGLTVGTVSTTVLHLTSARTTGTALMIRDENLFSDISFILDHYCKLKSVHYRESILLQTIAPSSWLKTPAVCQV
jgi:hypothetical protein